MKANHVLCSVPRLLLPLLVALAYVPLSAHAQTRPTMTGTSGVNVTSLGGNVTGYSITTSGSNVPIAAGGSASVGTGDFTWSMKAGGAAGSGTMSIPTATATAQYPLAGQNGRSLPVTVATQPASKLAAGMAIAKTVFKVATPIGNILALAQLLDQLGLKYETDANGANVVYKEQITGFVWIDGASRQFQTCADAAAFYTNYFTTVEPRRPTVQTTCRPNGNADQYGPLGYFLDVTEGIGSAQGTSTASFGLNRSGTPVPARQNLNQDQLANEIANASGWPSAMGDAIPYAIRNGEPIEVENPRVSGPSTLAGPTGTTTSYTPDGTRIDRTSTTTNNVTYNNNNVTINTTTAITNVYTYPNGTTSTTTQTVPGTGDGTTSPGDPNPTPTEDLCAKNPDALACAKFGEVQDAQLPTKDMSVSFSPLPFTSNATCPNPATFQLVNLGEASGSYALSFTPLCDAATTYVRPLVLLISAALAAFIFVGGLKT